MFRRRLTETEIELLWDIACAVIGPLHGDSFVDFEDDSGLRIRFREGRDIYWFLSGVSWSAKIFAKDRGAIGYLSEKKLEDDLVLAKLILL